MTFTTELLKSVHIESEETLSAKPRRLLFHLQPFNELLLRSTDSQLGRTAKLLVLVESQALFWGGE